MLTQKYVRWLFNYHAATGALRWRVRSSNRIHIGDRAGKQTLHFKRRVRIDGKDYVEARVIWLWMTGVWPAHEIDHADGCPNNNSWSNLREATHGQNQANRRKSKPNRLKWVRLHKSGRYEARVQVHGVQRYLGCFDTEQEAHNMAYSVAQQLHGQFVRPS